MASSQRFHGCQFHHRKWVRSNVNICLQIWVSVVPYLSDSHMLMCPLHINPFPPPPPTHTLWGGEVIGQ